MNVSVRVRRRKVASFSQQYLSLLQKVLKKLLALEQIPDQLEQNMKTIETQRNLEESGKKRYPSKQDFCWEFIGECANKSRTPKITMIFQWQYQENIISLFTILHYLNWSISMLTTSTEHCPTCVGKESHTIHGTGIFTYISTRCSWLNVATYTIHGWYCWWTKSCTTWDG